VPREGYPPLLARPDPQGGEMTRDTDGRGLVRPRIMGLMTCDLCTEDDGKGIHYHAFIEGRHYWVCASCKARLRVETEHTDE